MISFRILVFYFLILFTLTQNDPKNLLTEDAWMIDFYAPWCGHCINMSTQWDKFATQMKGLIKVAKIDASENSKFNNAYGLKGFPHIVFIPAGNKNDSTYFTHTGTRTAQAFQKWVMQKIDQNKRSKLERLTDQQKWNQTCIGSHSDFCILFFLPTIPEFSEQERDFYLKTIKTLAKRFIRQPISWLWTEKGSHKGIQQLFGLQKVFPQIVLINPTGRRFAVMQKPFTEDDFTEWLENVWDIEFKQYEGKLPFGDQMPVLSASQMTSEL